jgi:protease-4
VDKIGGLDAAIKEAAVLGKKKNIQHKIIQNTTKMLTIFLQASFAQSKENFIKQEIGQENYNLLQEVKRLQIQKVQAMLPFKINIR